MSDVRCDYCNGHHPTSQHNEQLPQPTPFPPISTQNPLPCPDGSIPASKSYVNAKQAESGAAVRPREWWILFQGFDVIVRKTIEELDKVKSRRRDVKEHLFHVIERSAYDDLSRQLAEAKALGTRWNVEANKLGAIAEKLTREHDEIHNKDWPNGHPTYRWYQNELAKLKQELSEARAELSEYSRVVINHRENIVNLSQANRECGKQIDSAKALIRELVEGLEWAYARIEKKAPHSAMEPNVESELRMHCFAKSLIAKAKAGE